LEDIPIKARSVAMRFHDLIEDYMEDEEVWIEAKPGYIYL
jgi:hypothetical protein